VVVGAVRHEGVQFEEGVLIQKEVDAVSCGPPAAGADGFLTLQTATEAGRFPLCPKLLDAMVNVAFHVYSTPARFFIQALIHSSVHGVLHRGSSP
jgi:hypothetical protein